MNINGKDHYKEISVSNNNNKNLYYKIKNDTELIIILNPENSIFTIYDK